MVKLDCAQKALERLFYKHGKLVGRKPLPFIIVPLLVSLFSATGFLRLNIISDSEYLYTPINGQSKQERAHFMDVFPENHTSRFVATRRHKLDGFVQVILTDESSGGNVFTESNFEEIVKLDKTIEEIMIVHSNTSLSFTDVCAKWNGTCSLNIILEIFNRSSDNVISVPLSYPIHAEQYFIGSSIGGVITQNGTSVSKVKSAMLIYYVKYIEVTDILISNIWLDKVKEHLLPLKTINGLQLTFQTSLSLDEELAATTVQLMPNFAIAYVVLLVFSILSCVMLDCVRSKPWVAVAGEVSAGLAVITAMGVLMACGVILPDSTALMPFLVIGIGIDDMFVMLSAWRQSSYTTNTEERMGETMKVAAVSITITSLTDALAFAAGAISPFRSVMFFGVYTVVAVLLCYVYAVTFLAGCMVYSGRREEHNRHVITQKKILPKDKAEGRSFLFRLCCTGGDDVTDTIIPIESKEGRLGLPLITRFFKDIYTPFIMRIPVKIVIIGIYIIYLGFGIWGSLELTEGIKVRDLVSSSSYIVDFYDALEAYYVPNYGPRIMVAFTDSLNYSDVTVRSGIFTAIEKFQNSTYFLSSAEMTESWFVHFDQYLTATNQTANNMQELIIILTTNFLQLPRYSIFEVDIHFNDLKTEILESRFLIQATAVTTSVEERDLMLAARKIAEESHFDMTVYHPNFIFYDQYTVILSNTLQTIGIAVGSILLISAILLSNVLTIVMVIFSVMSILIGVLGYMVWWGIPLNSVTTIYLAMAIGFSVDFSAHVCYHFATSKGNDPKDKAIETLAYLGHPIVQGAVSTILGVIVLAPSDNFLFVSFFKIVFLVMVVGFVHGVVFLPVMLALIDSAFKKCCGKKNNDDVAFKRHISGQTNSVKEGWI